RNRVSAGRAVARPARAPDNDLANLRLRGQHHCQWRGALPTLHHTTDWQRHTLATHALLPRRPLWLWPGHRLLRPAYLRRRDGHPRPTALDPAHRSLWLPILPDA